MSFLSLCFLPRGSAVNLAWALGTGAGLHGLAAKALRDDLISAYWSVVAVASCSRAKLLFVAVDNKLLKWQFNCTIRSSGLPG